ncbi:MAG TPA: carbohydrate porin [Sphingomonas sp.]|uniref:carbohydrate porin n=1 Tax=Sphingomonas sp. TaxID=28214 RepID=UPI002ED911F9
MSGEDTAQGRVMAWQGAGMTAANRIGMRMLLGAAALGSAASGQAQAIDLGAPAPEPTAPQTASADTKQRPRLAVTRARDTSPSALIGDTQSTPPPGLIGDWQQIRTRLGRRGIGVTARYASESGYNVTGGERRLFRETGQFDVGMLLDLEKLAGLTGGAFQATITWRRGQDLTSDAGLNALQQVQEIYGRGQTLRVTQLWYEQRLGSRVEVKLGRTNPGEDFAVFSCHFQNLSFCGAQPGNVAGDYWYNWPVSQWGARVRVDVKEDFYVQGGAYEINPRNLRKRFFIGHFKGATGVLVPVEAGWSRGGDDGRVASYKIGGWIATADSDDVRLDIDRRPIAITGMAPLRRSGRYGVYVAVQRQLTGTSKDGKSLTGLGMFANLTQTDRKTSVTDNQIALGLFYKGLMPAVPGDVLGLGVARTNVNGRAAADDRLTMPDQPRRDAEYAAELYYSIQPLDWLEIRPNLQWIHQPGGVRDAGDVGVLGLKAAITL